MFFKLFLTSIILNLQVFAAVKLCEQSFLHREDDTDDLMSYVDHLYVLGDFPQEKMISWLKKTATGQVDNPVPEESSLLRGELKIQHDAFNEILSRNLNRQKLKTLAEEKLKKIFHESLEKSIVVRSTRAPAFPMKFHAIEPAEFVVDMQINETWKVEPTSLRFDHRFEMMDAPVTQSWFATLLGHNPSRLQTGPDAGTVTVAGKEVNVLFDYPVDRVDWSEAVQFANKLSARAHLKPAYVFDETKQQFVADAPGNNILLTEGFRLPLGTEYFYIQTHGGTRRNPFETKEEALRYAWLSGNSARRTHVVRELQPIVAQGKNFYDVLGNVSSWSHETFVHKVSTGKIVYVLVKIHGSCFIYSYDVSRGQYQAPVHHWPPDTRYEGLGIRLVRTLHGKDQGTVSWE